MFHKFLLSFLILGNHFTQANGQQLTIETYTHQLLFNIFKESPDTSIKTFLQLYTPSLFQKKLSTPENGSSNGSNEQKEYKFEIHSFMFTKHPFVSATFTSGKLELMCQRYNEPKGVQVYDVKLWFEFDTQPEAEMAFSKLIETFIPISTVKRFSSSNGSQKAEFIDTRITKGFNKVQFRLTADNLDRHRFKILFETINDL